MHHSLPKIGDPIPQTPKIGAYAKAHPRFNSTLNNVNCTLSARKRTIWLWFALN